MSARPRPVGRITGIRKRAHRPRAPPARAGQLRRLVSRNPAGAATGRRDQSAGYARRSCPSRARGRGFDSHRLHSCLVTSARDFVRARTPRLLALPPHLGYVGHAVAICRRTTSRPGPGRERRDRTLLMHPRWRSTRLLHALACVLALAAGVAAARPTAARAADTSNQRSVSCSSSTHCTVVDGLEASSDPVLQRPDRATVVPDVHAVRGGRVDVAIRRARQRKGPGLRSIVAKRRHGDRPRRRAHERPGRFLPLAEPVHCAGLGLWAKRRA